MIAEQTKTSFFQEIMTKSEKINKKTQKNRVKLIIGLGNPEKKYFQTYHNIGFIFVDKMAEMLDIKINKKECKSLTGQGFIEREETTVNSKTGKIENKIIKEKIILAKPQTYMNLSGQAALELVKKYKLSLDEILIVLDDIDLEAGTYRYRESGSGGTHNGLRNVVELLKSQNFKRVRIGIGKDERMELADYVLSKISQSNMEKIQEAMQRAVQQVETLIK